MVLSRAASELVSKYTVLPGRVGEFPLASAVLYRSGRFVVDSVVRWVFLRRDLEPTLERTVEEILRVRTALVALAVGAWVAGFRVFLGGPGPGA